MSIRFPINRFISLAGLSALSFLALGSGFLSPAAYAADPLTSYFDNSGFNDQVDFGNIVGTGTMTYSGSNLGDGSYDYTSFSGLALNFSFNSGAIVFTASDLITDPGAVGLKIVIIGSTFQFAAPANGFSNGSAEFVNGAGDYFTFSPEDYYAFAYYLKTGATEGAGYSDGVILYQGTYGAGAPPVAEPQAEAFAGLADYGLYVTRNYARQAATAPVVSDIDGWRVSASYTGYSNGTDSSLNDADYDLRSNGAMVGASHAVGHGVTLGGFVAADDARASSSRLRAEGEGYAAGVIANYLPKPDSRLSFDANAGYAEYSFDTDRRTASGLASAKEIDSKASTVELDARYILLKFDRAQVSALVGTSYTHVAVDGFTETGSDTLVVDGLSEEMFAGQAGFETRVSVTSRLAVNAHATYEHNFSDSHRNVAAEFVGSGAAFTVRAPGLDADVMNVGVGASVLLTDRLALSAYYNSGFAEDTELASAYGARLSCTF